MNDNEKMIAETLAVLWADQRPAIEERIACLMRLVEQGPDSRQALEDARGAAHKLVGSLGMYGVVQGGEVARRIRDQIADTPIDLEELAIAIAALRIHVVNGPGGQPTAATSSASVATGSGPCVLVIDDDPVILAALDARLSHDGFRVVTAESALDAWERISESRPDVVILDLEMPYVHGVSLLNDLRADPWIGDVPILVHSGHETSELLDACLASGATAFVSKGDPLNALPAEIHRILAPAH
jgi:CheY-like chemotaxis protein